MLCAGDPCPGSGFIPTTGAQAGNEAGLIIAIPAQLAYNWYNTKITRFVRDIETATNMLMETFRNNFV